MTAKSWQLCLVTLLASGSTLLSRQQTPTFTHRTPGKIDRFVECARALSARPLLVALLGPWQRLDGRCATTEEEFQQQLSALRVRAVPAGAWTLVYERRLDTQGLIPGLTTQWNTVHVELQETEWQFEGRRRIDASELSSVSQAIQAVARPPVVALPPVGATEGRPNDTLKLALFVDPVVLGPGRPESIVAFYGHRNGWARVVYGEYRAGRYVPLWDSPLFGAEALGYDDLDGDGVDEILVQGRFGQSGWMIVAFTHTGEELTRQPECKLFGYTAPNLFDFGGFACPISGNIKGPVEFERRKDGKTDLIGAVWSQGRRGATLGPVRFTLNNGRYVRDPAKPAPKDN